MMSPFRTPAPPDDSAELAEIEEWLMHLPAPPGYRVSTEPLTGWKRVVVTVLSYLWIAAHLGYVLATIAATPEIPGLVIVDVIYVAGIVLATPWGARRLARWKMRRAGLLPPKR